MRQTPYYVIDTDEFAKRAAMIRAALDCKGGRRIPLCFSIKANPFLLHRLPEGLDHVEVCSPGELEICIALGVKPESIIYSGVMKEKCDIERAVSYGAGILTCESIRHATLISEVMLECIPEDAHEAVSVEKKAQVILRLTSGTQFGMSLEDIEYILYSLIFEVSSLGDVSRIQSEDALCSITADRLQTLDNPRIDFVAELAEQYILISILFAIFTLRHFSPYFDLATYEHACKLNVATAFTDTFLNLIRVHEYLDLVGFLYTHVDRRNLRRVKRSLNEELSIVCPLEYVNVFVSQLAHDSDDSRSLHTDAGSDRVNALVIRLYSDLRPLSRYTYDLLYSDEAVENLRNLLLEEFLEELI